MNASPPRWEDLHYRLVSLWDIMDRFRLDKFMEAYHLVAVLNQTATNLHDVNRASYLALSKAQFTDLKDQLSLLVDLLTEQGLTLSAMSAQKALEQTIGTDRDVLGQDSLKNKMVIGATELIPWKATIKDLLTRVRDEFKSRYVLIVPPEKVQFYHPNKPLFGPSVAS
jgi:hypothetical protein